MATFSSRIMKQLASRAASAGQQPILPPTQTGVAPVGPGGTITRTVPGGPVPGPAGLPPTQSFGPGDDLRSTQINPFVGEREERFRTGTGSLYDRLLNQPDLTQAGLDRLGAFEEAGERGFQRRVQDVGRRAAALGRVGAGQTGQDLNDALIEREAELARGRRALAGELAGQQGAESRANLGVGLDAEEMARRAGFGAREELRGERDFQQGLAERAQQQASGGAGYYGGQAASTQNAAVDALSRSLVGGGAAPSRGGSGPSGVALPGGTGFQGEAGLFPGETGLPGGGSPVLQQGRPRFPVPSTLPGSGSGEVRPILQAPRPASAPTLNLQPPTTVAAPAAGVPGADILRQQLLNRKVAR